MKTEFCKIGALAQGRAPDASDAEILDRAAEILRSGGLVAFPTETVYGLGANALDAEAAKKIYAAKGRPSDNPLIIHIANVADADKYCYTNELYACLAERFLPGPLTVILKKRDVIPLTVTGGLDTVAVRLPSDPTARELIRRAGIPIAAPSANRSGKPSPTKAEHVLEDMDGRIEMIIDGGECQIGLESTIVSISDGHLNLLRPGGITVEMLEDICPVSIDKAVTEKLSDGERPLAPGMKYRHYAPDTKVVLLDGSDAEVADYIKRNAPNGKIGLILSDNDAHLAAGTGAELLTYGDGDIDEAHRLFALLREVDRLGCDVIYARLPDKKGIGLAVYNRILKAAGYEILRLG